MNKPKKIYLPVWFPSSSCWLKSLIMVSFLTILVTLVKAFQLGIYFWEKLEGSLELLVCFSIIILLLLIPAFALAHHFFLLFFYVIREIFHKNYPDGLCFFPGIISWWKALYSWLVIMISTLAAILVFTLILPWFNLNYETAILEKSQWLYPETFSDKLLLFVFISIWLTVAAKLYQFEFLSNNYFRFIQTNYHLPSIKSTVNPIKSVGTKKVQKQRQIDLNNTNDELAKSCIYYRVNQTRESQKTRNTFNNKRIIHSQNNHQNKLLKTIKNNILVLLIIPLLALGVYRFSQWQLPSENPVLVVTEIPAPIPQEFNSETPEVAEIKTQPAPLSSPIEKSSSIPTTTIVLPPPDPFKLAVNRAMITAEMAQSAQSKVEWEAVASQWQDATELMKIVPASHPKYKQARKKIKEYQSYANYAIRVAETQAK